MWFEFWDMHSGGKCKLPPYEHILIEAFNKKEACIIFCNRFRRNPFHITCRCCGEDYAITEMDSLKPVFTFQKMSLEDFLKQPNILVVYSKDIKPEERIGELPIIGYYD